MLTTNLLLGTRMLKRNVEAMANNDKPKEKKNEEEENSTEEMSNEKANKKVKEKMQPNIDYAATLEQAYDNLDNLIGQDGIKKMGEQTERLATKQKELMQNIEAMAPMLQKAGSMLKAMPLEGLGNLQTNVTDALNKLSGKTGGNK
jgi:Na+/phosphate symporter